MSCSCETKDDQTKKPSSIPNGNPNNPQTNQTRAVTYNPHLANSEFQILNKTHFEQAKKDAGLQGKVLLAFFGRITDTKCKEMLPVLSRLITEKYATQACSLKIDCDNSPEIINEDVRELNKEYPWIKAYANLNFAGIVYEKDENGLETLIQQAIVLLSNSINVNNNNNNNYQSQNQANVAQNNNNNYQSQSNVAQNNNNNYQSQANVAQNYQSENQRNIPNVAQNNNNNGIVAQNNNNNESNNQEHQLKESKYNDDAVVNYQFKSFFQGNYLNLQSVQDLNNAISKSLAEQKALFVNFSQEDQNSEKIASIFENVAQKYASNSISAICNAGMYREVVQSAFEGDSSNAFFPIIQAYTNGKKFDESQGQGEKLDEMLNNAIAAIVKEESNANNAFDYGQQLEFNFITISTEDEFNLALETSQAANKAFVVYIYLPGQNDEMGQKFDICGAQYCKGNCDFAKADINVASFFMQTINVDETTFPVIQSYVSKVKINEITGVNDDIGSIVASAINAL
jgi:thiol-disulfide isomerase/thioredoxin